MQLTSKQKCKTASRISWKLESSPVTWSHRRGRVARFQENKVPVPPSHKNHTKDLKLAQKCLVREQGRHMFLVFLSLCMDCTGFVAMGSVNELKGPFCLLTCSAYLRHNYILIWCSNYDRLNNSRPLRKKTINMTKKHLHNDLNVKLILQYISSCPDVQLYPWCV